jgi:hypothetical protein
VVKCVTKAITITSGTIISVKINSTITSCSNSDTSKCAYSTSTSMPIVSSAVISTDTITFTGTNFMTSGYTIVGSYNGVASTTGTVTSSTSASVTFAKGVPVSSTALIPTLFFADTTSSVNGHYASITQTLTNSLALTATTSSSLSCSFAGGCLLGMSVNGLSSSLANSVASVTVCG